MSDELFVELNKNPWYDINYFIDMLKKINSNPHKSKTDNKKTEIRFIVDNRDTHGRAWFNDNYLSEEDLSKFADTSEEDKSFHITNNSKIHKRRLPKDAITIEQLEEVVKLINSYVWHWGLNSQFKYVEYAVDLCNPNMIYIYTAVNRGGGQPATLDNLKYQYSKDKVIGTRFIEK